MTTQPQPPAPQLKPEIIPAVTGDVRVPLYATGAGGEFLSLYIIAYRNPETGELGPHPQTGQYPMVCPDCKRGELKGGEIYGPNNLRRWVCGWCGIAWQTRNGMYKGPRYAVGLESC